MQPSSLIFVLVVTIWGAYLLQYWIKRRDHLATVRSVDRFSAAMRVLDDHRMMRRETPEPTPRSYAVAPTRAARPEVTVKHAGAPERSRAAEPVVGAPRRVRGLTLLAMLVLLPAAALGAALGPLPWWVPVAWLVGTVGAFGWLRQAVQAEREAAARARAEERREASPATRPRVEETRPEPAERSVPTRTTSTAAAPFDIAEQEARAETTAAVADPEPGTWQPMPVPPPVYTMKAKAERPEPAPIETAAPAPVDAEVPQVIDIEDEELPAIAGWG